MSATMPDTASKSGPTGSCALRMDRLCPAGQEEAAGFARCLLSTQPTDHSISLGTFLFTRKKWDMQDQQQQRRSKLTFGMLPADHGAHLLVPEFKKPNISVSTIISLTIKSLLFQSVCSVSEGPVQIPHFGASKLFLSHNKRGDVQTHFYLYFLWVLS